MSNVTAVALGGQPTPVTDVETVGELAKKLNLGEGLQVKVNDEPASYDTVLEDYQWVTFGEKVKGGH